MKTSLKNTDRRNVKWFKSVSTVQNGCWLWSRYKISDGYGRLTYRGKQVLAHRLVKLLAEEMSDEQFNNPSCVVMHKCDQPSCVNPRHLIVGTQRENIADRGRKNRTAKHLDRRDKLGRFKNKTTGSHRPTNKGEIKWH